MPERAELSVKPESSGKLEKQQLGQEAYEAEIKLYLSSSLERLVEIILEKLTLLLRKILRYGIVRSREVNLGGCTDYLLTKTVVGFQSIYRFSKLMFIFSSLLDTSWCCEETCYSAYKDGSLDLQDVRDGSPTIVPINFTGVVTIEAAYIPGYKAQWEYIRFKKNEDHEPLVMQFYTPNEKYTTLTIFGEDEIGVYPDSRYSVDRLFNNITEDIIIQVSDVHVKEDNFYRIYLGEPGNAHISNYSYQSKNNWDVLSFMRFSTTTQIKTDNKAIYFKSVTVCSDDTPILCGESVETVAVSRGEAFNLSCSVYGAPYLEAVWSNVTTGDNISEQPVYTFNGFLQTTTISIDNFNGNHMGEWKCYWRNKNFGTLSRAKVFHVVELVSKPSRTTYVIQKKSGNQVFQWVIKNKLSEESREQYNTLLHCKEENSTMESGYVQYEENSAVSKHSATLILPENITSDNVTCTLYLVVKSGENNTERLGVLDSTTLFREGYHCEAGYYGVGEECVECDDNLTSPPRSSKCYHRGNNISTSTNDVMNEPAGLLILIPILLPVVLALAIIIALISVHIYYKTDCIKFRRENMRGYSNVKGNSTWYTMV